MMKQAHTVKTLTEPCGCSGCGRTGKVGEQGWVFAPLPNNPKKWGYMAGRDMIACPNCCKRGFFDQWYGNWNESGNVFGTCKYD